MRGASGECKAEAAAWGQEFKAECREAKAGCKEECQDVEIPDGGGLE